VLSAELVFGAGTSTETKGPFVPPPAARPVALDVPFAELDNRSGHAFTAEEKSVHRFFPQLSAAIGAAAVAEIVACSYVAGMEAPGLHSMLSKLDVAIVRAAASDGIRAGLHYHVVYHDERFRKARIAVNGRSITGTLEAFVRVPPVEQASIQTIAVQVDAAEFEKMNALIIGGSRGLGELTAKLIAAGGGTSTITYAVGKTEAERIASQIREWGGDVQVLPYDVRIPAAPQLTGLSRPFTHLFYFATNAIFRPKKNLVSPPILADFITFYVLGFHEICLYLTQAETAHGSKLTAYYPSSVAVEERPAGMTEYAMAKAAGEQLCRDMNQFLPNLHVLTSRLPRLLTDQTAGIMPEKEIDPVSVLLPIVREMRRLSNG
jgi:NADP-dependent 3-hydroxy acid dehydrogenase YdfG